MIGAVPARSDAEQVFDLTGADAHGEGGDRQASPGGLVERRRPVAGPGSRPEGVGGSRRLQTPLDLASVLVDRLAAASGLLGLASDGPIDLRRRRRRRCGPRCGAIAWSRGRPFVVAGDLGRDPVDHGAASPSTQTVNSTAQEWARFATKPTIDIQRPAAFNPLPRTPCAKVILSTTCKSGTCSGRSSGCSLK